MKILKLTVAIAVLAMLFGGCTKEVKKDVFAEKNITKPILTRILNDI